jgi:hypothetical protein
MTGIRQTFTRVLLLAVALAAVGAGTAAAAPEIHVDGNQLVDGSGAPVRLIGINRASFEYTCVTPDYDESVHNGVSAGPVDAQAIDAMKTWHINVVRVPLNEDCWLGVNPVKRLSDHVKRLHGKAAKREGKKVRRRYQAGVKQFVSDLQAAGLYVILDLHWSAPGKHVADKQLSGPDTSHSVDFWRSVATTFKDDPGVVFDLFNEPVNISWRCLRDGGCPLSLKQVKTGQPKRGGTVVGMQKLVDTVRKTGATQPLMISGLDYTDDLSRWLEFEPSDPLGQLVASFHNYGADQPDGYFCHQECWDDTIAPLAEQVPVVTGEFGQDIFGPPCGTSYTTDYMDWADEHGVSYVAWWWFVETQYDEPMCLDLITDYLTGEPTDYGAPIRDHFLAVNP